MFYIHVSKLLRYHSMWNHDYYHLEFDCVIHFFNSWHIKITWKINTFKHECKNLFPGYYNLLGLLTCSCLAGSSNRWTNLLWLKNKWLGINRRFGKPHLGQKCIILRMLLNISCILQCWTDIKKMWELARVSGQL